MNKKFVYQVGNNKKVISRLVLAGYVYRTVIHSSWNCRIPVSTTMDHMSNNLVIMLCGAYTLLISPNSVVAYSLHVYQTTPV